MRNVLLVEAPLGTVVQLLGQTEYHMTRHADLSTVDVIGRFVPVEDCTARAVKEATHIVVCSGVRVVVIEKVLPTHTPVRTETPVENQDTSYW